MGADREVVPVVVLTRPDGGSKAGGEVFLQAAGDSGPDPFTESTALGSEPEPGTADPSVAPSASRTGTQATRGVDGAAPGLYGGTREVARRDVEQQIKVLKAAPDKSRAFASVQDIEPSAVPGYLRGLTPVTLRMDTRVTDNGYSGPRGQRLSGGAPGGYGCPRRRPGRAPGPLCVRAPAPRRPGPLRRSPRRRPRPTLSRPRSRPGRTPRTHRIPHRGRPRRGLARSAEEAGVARARGSTRRARSQPTASGRLSSGGFSARVPGRTPAADAAEWRERRATSRKPMSSR